MSATTSSSTAADDGQGSTLQLDGATAFAGPAAGASPTRRHRTRLRFKATPVRAPLATIALPQRSVPRVSWQRRYQLGLIVVDLIAAGTASAASFVLRFGTGTGGRFDWITAFLLPIAWILVVGANGAYEGRFVGVGSAEFQRIFRGFLHLTALVSFSSFVAHANLARGFVLLALPMALLFDLLARYAARKWLHAQRRQGHGLNSVLLVGDGSTIQAFTELLERDRYAGMRPVGACVPAELIADPSTLASLEYAGVPLVGDVDSIAAAVLRSGADAVAVVSSAVVGAEKLRWISWQLEGSSTDLIVSPGLTEVAGPRLHVQPVAGLPLLHVEEPQFTGVRRFAKATFDRSVAALALLFLAPLFAVLWTTVRFTSKGPGFFRQTRIGKHGKAFTMIKFRSMFIDAEARLGSLLGDNHNSDGLLFKIPNDPRLTRAGRVLRKLSLDELPQLFNVLSGQMSLVGPRPPLPSEVARYGDDVRRRLLVKPGLTGLWQISGRSDLSWDESVRLDLRYVENWSFTLDLMILFKTAGAVLRASGAY